VFIFLLGAIGSHYKIDASYLSPDVNMSARLEAATKQFGVSILVSHTFHKLLSPPVQEMCRLIDCVTVKGSEKPMSLYTFDLYDIEANKHLKLNTLQQLEMLHASEDSRFRTSFDQGVANYLDGRWPDATCQIEQALHCRPEDGPSILLLKVMAAHGNVAPASWRGYRTLTDKS
jgi:hypothetical protein